MIKAVVYKDSSERLVVSTDLWPGDETVDIPPKLYEAYWEAYSKLERIENMILECQRQQERSRAYLDD